MIKLFQDYWQMLKRAIRWIDRKNQHDQEFFPIIGLAVIAVFLAFLWITDDTPLYRYCIRYGDIYAETNEYTEKDGCILYNNSKVCGCYVVYDRGIKK